MTEIKHYCDHCGKELDGMKDYLACDIDVWCGEFQTDLCADCLNQLGRMVKDFCSYGERKDNG